MSEENFFNRELSWIEFNYRVLEEALDKTNPILERLKFLSIFSNNLDEFIMVRISGLVSQVKSNYKKKDPSGMSPAEILEKLQKRITELVEIEYNCFRDDVLRSMEDNGFKFYTSENIPKKYKESLKTYFIEKLQLILTPMAIDQSRPFPFLRSKNINILIKLSDLNKDNNFFAVIPVPLKERFIPIDDSKQKYIYAEELITLFANEIFKGYEIIETCVFRITRDAELSFDEEDIADLLSTIEDELKKRVRGAPIRLEIESSASNELVEYLTQKIQYYSGYNFKINGPLDLAGFFDIALMSGFDNLQQKILIPVMPVEFQYPEENIFKVISMKDRLIHLPYESFEPVIRFIEEASIDEKVLAIKITLYRISNESPIINALKRAAENGKQVTVLIELKARFDEAQNIDMAKELEKAGCHVIYGLVGLKIHAKIALVVREEEEGIARYIHLSTGNYNEKTARVYTDIGLFTSKNSFGRDVSSIFNLLTGYSEPPRWKKLVCSPLDLRNFFLEKIKIEIENVEKGGKGRITIKINSLIDKKIIEELYRASNTGVKIRLIVRGMCCLKPGIKKLSENIKVISIVDRFLEHSRIFYFYNSGDEDIYLSSADWMERNLDRRIEILFPILEPDLKKELRDYLDILLNDNTKARILQPNGMYIRKKESDNIKKINNQMETYKQTIKHNAKIKTEENTLFIPKKNPEIDKRRYNKKKI